MPRRRHPNPFTIVAAALLAIPVVAAAASNDRSQPDPRAPGGALKSGAQPAGEMKCDMKGDTKAGAQHCANHEAMHSKMHHGAESAAGPAVP